MQKKSLDQVAFRGVPAIRSAIDDLKKLDIHDDHLTKIIPQIEAAFKDLSPRFLNQVSTTTLYRRHVHAYLQFPSKDTTNQVKLLMHQVERHLNNKIIITKRHDTKRRLTREKGRVMSFYKSNSDQFKYLFDIHNLFLKAQRTLQDTE